MGNAPLLAKPKNPISSLRALYKNPIFSFYILAILTTTHPSAYLFPLPASGTST